MTPAASRKLMYAAAVYVSEARDAGVLRQLRAVAAGAPAACLANLFVDEPYNRTNFTLVAASPPALADAAAALARAALALVDLRQHAATHPRLGAVDHISCHPLPAGDAACEAPRGEQQQQQQQQQQQKQQSEQEAGAAAAATDIARRLGEGPDGVPVFTYGWAHPQQRQLDDVRRRLGYFRGAAAGSWQGGLEGGAPAAGAPLALAPCFGPGAAPSRSGVCCVGAAPWVVNFNVLLRTEELAAARAVARAVSERGGGLAGVQAMALRHARGVEVACNLLRPAERGEREVLSAVQRLAAQRGLAVDDAYRTNKAPDELVAAALAHGL